MKKEKELYEKIAELENEILDDVMTGCFNDFDLHRKKCWIEALKYVLGEE